MKKEFRAPNNPESLSNLEKKLESEVRHEELEKKVFEKRHPIAVAGYYLERFLRENPTGETKDFTEQHQKLLEKIPPKTKEDFFKIIELFREKTRHAKKTEKKIADVFLEDYTENPEMFGAQVYRDLLSKESKGRVSFEREGSVFVIAFSNEKDFKNFDSKLTSKERTQKIPEGVHYANYFLNGDRIDKIKIANLIALNKENPHGTSRNAILAHEKQHEINHSLLPEKKVRFALTDKIPPFSRPKKHYDYSQEVTDVKDELLAFIRAGGLGLEHSAAWVKGEYTKLYKKSPQKEKIDKTLDLIGTALKDAQKTFRGDEERTVMVYQLLEVPFYRLPRYIEGLNRYYTKARNEAQHILEKENISSQAEKQFGQSLFPTEWQDRIDAYQNAVDKYNAFLERQLDRITSPLTGFEVEKQLTTLKAEVKKKEALLPKELEDKTPTCTNYSSYKMENGEASPLENEEEIRNNAIKVLDFITTLEEEDLQSFVAKAREMEVFTGDENKFVSSLKEFLQDMGENLVKIKGSSHEKTLNLIIFTKRDSIQSEMEIVLPL